MKIPGLITSSLLFSTLCLAAPPSYLVTDLGTLGWAAVSPQPGSLPGTTEYERTAAGEVGSDQTMGPTGPVIHAYLLRNGQLTDLGVLPGAMGYTTGPTSIGRSLNVQAHVVGLSDSQYYHLTTGKPAGHAVLWNGTLTDLGTLSGDPSYGSVAEAINDFDEIVGNSEVMLNTGEVTNRAFVWIAGKMYNLTSYVSLSYSTVRLTDATNINCQGNIAAVGYDTRWPTIQRAYLLTRIGMPRPTCH